MTRGIFRSFAKSAIQNYWNEIADTLGNPETLSDPNWLPEVGNTTPDPTYPGAHAAVSAAARDVLVSVLRRDRFSFELPRRFSARHSHIRR